MRRCIETLLPFSGSLTFIWLYQVIRLVRLRAYRSVLWPIRCKYAGNAFCTCISVPSPYIIDALMYATFRFRRFGASGNGRSPACRLVLCTALRFRPKFATAWVLPIPEFGFAAGGDGSLVYCASFLELRHSHLRSNCFGITVNPCSFFIAIPFLPVSILENPCLRPFTEAR